MLHSRLFRLIHDRNYLLRLLLIALIWCLVCGPAVRMWNITHDTLYEGISTGNIALQEAKLKLFNTRFDQDYKTLEAFIEGFGIAYLKDSPNVILENMVQDISVILVFIFLVPLLYGTSSARKEWRLSRENGQSRTRIVLSRVFELAMIILIFNAVISTLLLLLQLGRTDAEPYNAIHSGMVLRFLLLRPLVLLAISGLSGFLVFLFQSSVLSAIIPAGFFLSETVIRAFKPELFPRWMPTSYLTDLDLFGRAAPDVALVLQAVAVCLGVILLWSAASIFVLYIRDIRRIED